MPTSLPTTSSCLTCLPSSTTLPTLEIFGYNSLTLVQATSSGIPRSSSVPVVYAGVSLASLSTSSTDLAYNTYFETSSIPLYVPIFATPTGYSCQPYLVTTSTSACLRITPTTYTVTETWHSTEYNCITTQISFVAAFTVLVTANVTER
jgi:hypothetical protein